MSDSDIDQIVPALIKAKKQFAPVVKDKTNPAFRSKYADLGAVLDAVEPALLENGLVLVQPTTTTDDGQIISLSILMHESGQKIRSSYVLRPAKEDPQGYGSALTYARRYQALALLGLAPEDDDGNAASQRRADPPAPPTDWLKELQEAQTSAQVKTLGQRAAAVGEFKKHETQFRSRLAELEAKEKEAATQPDDMAAATQLAESELGATPVES